MAYDQDGQVTGMGDGSIHWGRIESLNTRAGNDRPTFGFIAGDDGGRSYFFVPSGMQVTSPHTFDQLTEGMRVMFILIAHPKGPRAIEIRTVG